MKFDEMTWEEVEYIVNKIAESGVRSKEYILDISKLTVILIDGDGYIEVSKPLDFEDVHLVGNTWFGEGAPILSIGNPPYVEEREPKRYVISDIPKEMKERIFDVVNDIIAMSGV